MQGQHETAVVLSDEFKQAMRHLAGGVTIIATEHEGCRTGMAATAVCSVSANPPTILICINAGASAHEPIRESGRFSVNLLASGEDDIARRFSGETGVRGEERFAVGRWASLVTGAPILDSALAGLDCRVTEVVRMATHSVVLWSCGGSCLQACREALDLRPWNLWHLFSRRGWAVVVRSGAADHAANTSALTEAR
jgi:flavin reductase (DIM6/NTAB) family NADH-FMN oxidoreductase RutF